MPAMRRLLPDLAGADVLDLGCGFGDFARLARARGELRGQTPFFGMSLESSSGRYIVLTETLPKSGV
jgi:hypothetical protein